MNEEEKDLQDENARLRHSLEILQDLEYNLAGSYGSLAGLVGCVKKASETSDDFRSRVYTAVKDFIKMSYMVADHYMDLFDPMWKKNNKGDQRAGQVASGLSRALEIIRYGEKSGLDFRGFRGSENAADIYRRYRL